MKSDINVTPFIDVLLVLLIIFMILAPTPRRAIDASVPPAPDDVSQKTTNLVVEVRRGGYAINRTPVWTPRELEERLRTAFEAGSSRTLFILPEADVAYDRVMNALDAARGAGAVRIGMLDPERPARADAGPADLE